MQNDIADCRDKASLCQSFLRCLTLAAGTIRRYIHAYNEAGLDGLKPDFGQGRPLAVSWTKEQWLDLLAQSPANHTELETGAQNWSQVLLCRYLETYHQIEVTQTTISKTPRRVEIRWRRAKPRVHSPDPLYIVKRQRIADLQQLVLSGYLTSQPAAHARSDEPPKPATLVFLDSTNLHWCPGSGSTYGHVRHATTDKNLVDRAHWHDCRSGKTMNKRVWRLYSGSVSVRMRQRPLTRRILGRVSCWKSSFSDPLTST